MGKASYKIRETKNMRHFTYSGNLKDAIEKAKRDLQKEKENKEIAQWYWLYEKAKKAINTHTKNIKRKAGRENEPQILQPFTPVITGNISKAAGKRDFTYRKF